MGITKNIQSLERATQILELFQGDKSELSVKEISVALNLSKSTAFGLINTLSNLCYLRQNPESLKYSLGFKILSLSSHIQKDNFIAQSARSLMQKISDEFQETCLCAIEEQGSIVYVEKTESASSITINTRIGTKKPMYCTGVGKCFLAYINPEIALKYISRNKEAYTPNTITNTTQMLLHLKEIRENGYAFDNEEFELGLSCIAAPVFNSSKNVIASISLTGPSLRLKEAGIDRLAKAIMDTASKITSSLNI